ncbi:UNVERIFIED_ORG: hypothetical protein GGI57_000459 [Rhizobium aethiopicum]
MNRHASLSAPMMDINLITPVEKMARNEPCWCGIGLKYKKCHLDRENQKPVNLFEVEAKMLATIRKGYCSHPDPVNDPCGSMIIKAHTVQKKGGIAAIAEAGHVPTVKPRMKDITKTDGNPEPYRIGVNDASVFPGFCSDHDTRLFKPIEGKLLTFDKDTAFLFGYRAIAYELFQKLAQIKSIEAQRLMDRGHPFSKQVFVQKIMTAFGVGVDRSATEVKAWKAQFDARLLSRHRDDFRFVAVRFDEVLPFVAASAFHAEFTVEGKPLQRLGRQGNDDLEYATINVTTFGGQTVVVIGWIGSDTGPARDFADSFLAVPDHLKADCLFRILVIHTENLFLRESWWNGLDPALKAEFKSLVWAGTSKLDRSPDQYKIETHLFSAAPTETVVAY